VKKPLFLFATMAVLAALCSGCVQDDLHVVGVWERQIDEYLVRLSFDADGTFILQVGESNRSIYGEYELKGGVILLVDDDCDEIEGKYRVRVLEDAATFSVLNDTCEGRFQVVAGEWLMVGNQ
jgi:hypothetical protein